MTRQSTEARGEGEARTQHPHVAFITPERFAREQAERMRSTRGRLLIASCRSGVPLAGRVVERYRELLTAAGSEADLSYLEAVDFNFSDTETCVRLERDVAGCDVFLLQALYNPRSNRSVDQDYAAFFIAGRAFREWGANHVTAVLPYLAYARQDKPSEFEREPTTAKLMADLTLAAGVDRLLTWHPHYSQISGFYDRVPVNVLPALPLFLDQFRRFEGRDDVIVVAPDAGASKFVTYFGRALGLKSAIASKYRPRPEEAQVSEVIGDFAGKRVAIVLDDMISSGGTIQALVKKLVQEKGIRKVYVGVSHNLCMPQARERLQVLHADYHLQELVVTNSIPQTAAFRDLPFVAVRCLSERLAWAINRIHYQRPLSGLFDSDLAEGA